MNPLLRGGLALGLLVAGLLRAADPGAGFQAVPELGYVVQPDFFAAPPSGNFFEASGVALSPSGHIYLFQRRAPMLLEYDASGKFLRSLADGVFDHPHGLRVDPEGNLWATDDGTHFVVKLSPEGRVLMVLGRRNEGSESDWTFNSPADVGFGPHGEIYVADGYGNSRIVKFDASGKFLKAWGRFGTGPGEFILPHSVVVDAQGRVYVGDRENLRIQIFDGDGTFLKEWNGIGYPYGLWLTADGHVWVADGGFDRIVELDGDGKILGALGEPGHGPGQFAWAHFLAIGPDRKIFVADVLNWRFQVFVPTKPSGKLSAYVPSRRWFWDAQPSDGWRKRVGPPSTRPPAK